MWMAFFILAGLWVLANMTPRRKRKSVSGGIWCDKLKRKYE